MAERKELVEKWLVENKKLVEKRKSTSREKNKKENSRKLKEIEKKKKRSTKEKAVIFQKQNKKKQTRSERKMAGYLNKNKFNFEPQKIFFYGEERQYFYLSDFYLPDQQIVIEVDGKYHNAPEQQKRDWYKDQHYTKRLKLKLLRITNDKLSSLSVRSFKEILEKLIQSPAGSSVYLK